MTLMSPGRLQVTAQLQLGLQHNTDESAAANAISISVRICLHMHELRCEWCHRYSHAQVTFESQIAGDGASDMVWRLKNGETPAAGQVKQIVLLIGSNDLDYYWDNVRGICCLLSLALLYGIHQPCECRHRK